MSDCCFDLNKSGNSQYPTVDPPFTNLFVSFRIPFRVLDKSLASRLGLTAEKTVCFMQIEIKGYNMCVYIYIYVYIYICIIVLIHFAEIKG